VALVVWLFAPTAEAPGARAEAAPSPPAAAIATRLTTRLLTLAPGDTLNGVLTAAGVGLADTQAAIDALLPVFPPRELKPGQEMALAFSGAALQELRLNTAIDRDIVVTRAGDGSFAAHQRPRALTRVPELADDVDFQRDLQPEDSFEVLYERLYDQRGKAVGTGEIAYASMTLSGKTLRLYRYLAPGADAPQFFTDSGQSVKKALLRTPVDGARLSSGFGMRLHPILGYSKMHRGVDFAAPAGTPIMAAGDGVVESAGPAGAYGNLVVLKHDGIYETAYAHMSRIARGMRRGTHVRQGEIIGYVGATGRATGPHLHYEVRVNGEPTNPIAVKIRPGLRLAGAEAAKFHVTAQAIDRELLALRAATIVADVPEGRLPE
jgi:murein DD-endopeptidase MepM/ murein hydrolase activator NlpD